MDDRREFLIKTVGALALGGVGQGRMWLASASEKDKVAAPRSLRILILGGTGFIGPHHVRAAVARGHKVSVFNRGKSQADLPAEVERLLGDRNGDLESIKNRDWDAVIDLQTYSPGWVRTLGQILKRRVRHYTFISTVMTYARSADIVDEKSALLQQTEAIDPYAAQPSGWVQYGSFKVVCEREAEAQFPGKTLVVRPGVITGPGDKADHIAYWFARMARGGEILAPGNPLAPVQFIDARDLAEWVVRMVEQSETGIYNAVGPAMPMGMCELLGAARSLYSVPMHLTWVPSPWLIEQKLKGGEAPFFWVKEPHLAERDELWLSYRVSSKKARAKGLTFRSLATTLSDNLVWYKNLPAERQASPHSGWKAGVEERLLTAWHAHHDKQI